MVIEAAFATDFFGADGIVKAAEAIGDVGFVELGMIEVKNEGAAIDEFALAAKIVEAGAEVAVLTDAPALVGFIEAVDGDEVVAPDGEVAANEAALGLITTDDGKGPADGLEER